MSETSRFSKLTIEEYLNREEKSKVRHEFIDGQIFAMSGSTEAHNVICGNLFAIIHAHLRGSGCRAFINDMKVHIKTARSFYYPDIMVTCEPFEAKSVFKYHPCLIVEVLSPSTKQVDRREKLVAYRQLGSLHEYLLVHQDRKKIEFYQKVSDNQWDVSTLRGTDELLLQSINKPLTIPLGVIYEGLILPSTVEESEDEYEFA